MKPEETYIILYQQIGDIRERILRKLERNEIGSTQIRWFNNKIWSILVKEFHVSKEDFGYLVNGITLPDEEVESFLTKVEKRLDDEVDKFLKKEPEEETIKSQKSLHDRGYTPNKKYQDYHHERFLKLWDETKSQESAYDKLVIEYPAELLTDGFGNYIVQFRKWNKLRGKAKKRK